MRRGEFGDHIKTLSSLTSELVSVGQWLLLVLSDPLASLDTPSSFLYPSLSWTLSALCVWPLPSEGWSRWGGVYICVCVCYMHVVFISAHGCLHMTVHVAGKCVCMPSVYMILPVLLRGGAEACGGL